MSKPEDKRFFYVGSAIVLSFAAAGLITGTRPPTRDGHASGATAAPAGVDPARSYTELRKGRRGPASGMYENAFAWLRSLGPGPPDPVFVTEEQRAEALERRRERRAYAGAPPVIPHPIQEREAAACLACHEKGSLIAGLRAPMMSHKKYLMCVQCHAPQREGSTNDLRLANVGEENTFAGVQEAGPGETAWEGAPPTIPHPTFMREQCNSCHGPLGAQGLRTPHPIRASCTQCHAPAAIFDQGGPPALMQSPTNTSPPSGKAP